MTISDTPIDDILNIHSECLRLGETLFSICLIIIRFGGLLFFHCLPLSRTRRDYHATTQNTLTRNTCQVSPPPHRRLPLSTIAPIDDATRHDDYPPPDSTTTHDSKHAPRVRARTTHTAHTDPHTTISDDYPIHPLTRWWPCLITFEQFETVGGPLSWIRR